MTAPATSARENCLAHIKTSLEAMTAGATYNYTPDAVTRVDAPFFLWLDESLDVQYFIEVGQTRHTQDTSDGLWIGTMEVFITGAKRYPLDHINPALRAMDQPSTIRSKLLADMIVAMVTAHDRGGAARQTMLTDDAEVVEPEIEDLSGWAVQECRFEVEYEYREAAP